MTLDEYIRALRSGHDTESNLLIQITSHAVVDDMAREHQDYDDYLDPINYKYPLLSGSGYETGNLIGHQGVLKLAERRHVDPDGSIYNPGIIRCTGLGETYNDLKIGAPNATSGTLAYALDESALMNEVRSVDWLSDKLEVRLDIDGSGWASAEPVFEGMVFDGVEDNNAGIISFRIGSIIKQLKEKIYHDKWVGNDNITTFQYRNIVFGKIYEMPVSMHPTFKVGWDFVYYSGTTGYQIDDAAVTLYDEGQYGDLIATPQTDWGVATVATASDAWTLNASNTPVNHVYADVQGYDHLGSPGYANLKTAGAILKEAVGIARAADSNYNAVPILGGRTIQSASLDVVASKNDLICGINFAGHDLKHNDPSFPWDPVNVTGTAWDWLSVFSDFMGSSLCLFSIQRDGAIAFHYLLSAPTEMPVLTILDGDFSRVDKSTVVDYKYVFPTASETAGATTEESDFYKTYPERVAIHAGKYLAWTPSKQTEYDKAKTDIINRFGTHDYRFHDCPVAKALNIGDVVAIAPDVDKSLTSTITGYVTAIDRGTRPFVEVRA